MQKSFFCHLHGTGHRIEKTANKQFWIPFFGHNLWDLQHNLCNVFSHEFYDLSKMAYPESALHKEPLIHQHDSNDLTTADNLSGECGNISIRGL